MPDVLLPETLRFDAEPHRYYLEPSGAELAGVTRSLEECKLIDWSRVPRDILDAAAWRGTRVHIACHYLDDGDLDMASIEGIEGYLEAWERFKRDWGVELLLVEYMSFSAKWRYAGRMDRVITLPRKDGGRDRAVLDFKTGDWQDGYKYQMAAYNGVLPDPRSYRRIPLQLREDGQFRSHEVRCPPERYLADLNVFHSATTIWHAKRAA